MVTFSSTTSISCTTISSLDRMYQIPLLELLLLNSMFNILIILDCQGSIIAQDPCETMPTWYVLSLCITETRHFHLTYKVGKKNQWDKHCANVILGKANQTSVTNQLFPPWAGGAWWWGGEEHSFGDCQSVDTRLLSVYVPHGRGWLSDKSPWWWMCLHTTIKSTACWLFLFIPFHKGPAIMPVLLD